MQPGRREIYPLTSLRFFAAALVVFEHMQMLPGLEWLGFKSDFPGMAGVRIFFVLSGYILTYTYWQYDWHHAFGSNLKSFFWSRFARIYPLHWLTFFIALPLGLNSNTARTVVSDFPWLLTLTDRLWPGFFTAGSPPVKAAWTLSCEALFYLLTPLIFWLLTRRKNPLLASAIFFAVSSAVIYLLTVWFPNLNWTAYIELPQFLLGIVGFHLASRFDFSRWANGMIIVAIGLFAVAAGFDGRLSGTPCADFIVFNVYAPGSLLLILGCATAGGRVKTFLSLPFLVLLGHSSYALYLLHDPALRYLKVALNRMNIVLSLPAGILTAVVFTCLLVAASIICFKFYENPMRLKLRSVLKQSKPAYE